MGILLNLLHQLRGCARRPVFSNVVNNVAVELSSIQFLFLVERNVRDSVEGKSICKFGEVFLNFSYCNVKRLAQLVDPLLLVNYLCWQLIFYTDHFLKRSQDWSWLG